MTDPGPDKTEALMTLATMDRLAGLAPEQRTFLLSSAVQGYVAEGVGALSEGDLAAVARCFVKAHDQVKRERRRAGRRVRPAGWSRAGEEPEA